VRTAEQVITLSTHAVSCELGGETVILDIPSGQYYALSEIGARIWQLLEKPQSLTDVCDQLAQEYNVDRNRCEADVSALISQMASHGLITYGERSPV